MEQNRPTEVTLPLEVLDNIIGYLGTRPYQESAKLISDMQIAYNTAAAKLEAKEKK